MLLWLLLLLLLLRRGWWWCVVVWWWRWERQSEHRAGSQGGEVALWWMSGEWRVGRAGARHVRACLSVSTEAEE